MYPNLLSLYPRQHLNNNIEKNIFWNGKSEVVRPMALVCPLNPRCGLKGLQVTLAQFTDAIKLF